MTAQQQIKEQICEPCTFLPELVAACLPTSFSAIDQLSLLSGMPTPAKSCVNELPMDGFPACQCGKETLGCSIHPNTRESWIASMQDSLAKTLASLESKQAYLREPDQVFTAKSCASLAWYDQSSCSWRTYQQSFLTDSEPYSETWPRWGMTAGGSAFAHPMSERRITETDGSYLPTPTVTTGAQVAWDKTPGQTGGTSLAGWVGYFPTPTTIDAGTGRFNTSVGSSNHRPTLAMMVKKSLWPTPLTSDFKGASKNRFAGSLAYRGNLKEAVRTHHEDGQLNPNWVSWLMGFPIGFAVIGSKSLTLDESQPELKTESANSKAMATPKCQSKPQPPIDSLVESEVAA